MRIFDFLKKDRKPKALPPIRTVRPPGEARPARQKVAEPRKPPELNCRKEPTIETMLESAGDLELSQDPAEIVDNPYETHSWRLDPGKGARRVDDLSSINRDRADEQSKKDPDNPYDQGTSRKGW